MKKVNRIRVILFVFVAGMLFGVSSCGIYPRYRSPEPDMEDLYRDYAAVDTTNIADLSWNEFFTDSCLVSLIREGLENNADLQMAVTSIRQAEASLEMARASLFPSFSLSGQVSQVITGNADNPLSEGSGKYSLGITSSWEADLWGKLSRQSKAKYAQYLQSHVYRNLVQSSLIANIATSYYSLQALDERLQITLRTVDLLEENVRTMEALQESAMLNSAAVEQSKVLWLNTRLSVYDLKNSIRQMENSLSLLLGRKPGSIERTPFMRKPMLHSLSAGVPVQLLSRRPDVMRAELDFRSAFELTRAAKASFYPSVTLNSGSMIGFSASGISSLLSLDNLMANVIGGLTQPIFQRKQLIGNLKISEAQQEEAMIAFKNSVLQAGKEVSDILSTYDASLQKDVLRKEQIEATRKSVEYTKELLLANEANYTEVLTAEQNHLSAQLSAVNDRLEQLLCAVDLYRALGGGTE